MACLLPFLLVVLVSQALGSLQDVPHRPSVTCPEQHGLFPNPNDCSSYIHCIDSKAKLKLCSGGLHFNPHTRTCDWPQRANCKPGQRPLSDTPDYLLGELREDFTCPNKIQVTHSPDADDCSRFIRCKEGKAYQEECSPGLRFNQRSETCDYAEEVECAGDAKISCSTDDGMFPYENDCTRYIHCTQGIPTVAECPSGLHFNPTAMMCDYSHRAGCLSGSPAGDLTVMLQQQISEEPVPGVNCSCTCCALPVASNCSAYYMCLAGKPYLRWCSPGLVFNPSVRNCDYAANYKCPSPTEEPVGPTTWPASTVSTQPPTAAPTMPSWKCEDQEGLYPYPGDCSKFIECANGIPYVMNCPANLDFNPSTLECDYPEEAGCRGPVTTAGPTDPPVTYPSHVCKHPNEFLPYPGDCHKFIHCANYIPYVFDCPADLEFSMTTKRCEWPEDSGCSGPNPTGSPTEGPTSAPVTYPSDVCDKPNEFLPYPGDCHKFIHCANYIPYVFDCPANLEFSMKTLRCEWPQDAGCSGPYPTGTPTDTPTEGPTSEPVTYPSHVCKKRNEFLPYPGDCHKFIHCSNYIPYVFDCPANLEFSMKTHRCEWPEDAGCSGPYPTDKPTEPPTDPPVTYPSHTCKKPNEFLPYPGDCHKFIHCANYIPYVFTCPANLEFSMKTHRCEWPEDAGCSITTLKPTARPTDTPTEAPTSEPVTYPSHVCDKPNEFLPYPGDCHKFIHCSNYIPYVFDCPANLEFSMKTHRCEWPEDAGCSGTTVKPTAEPTEHPTEHPTEQPGSTLPPHICKKPNEFLPYPGDCHKFIHCSNYIPYVFDCPANLEFSMKTKRCEYPEDAGCSGPYPTEKPTEAPTAPPVTHPSHECKKPNEFLPYPGDCHKFIHCANYIPYVFTCPANLEFSMKTHRCEWPEDAGCSITTLKPTANPTDTPTEAPTSAPVTYPSHICDKPNEFLPYPGDCHKFIHCANYIPYVFDCPANLEFSMKTHRCEWPEDAGCSITTTVQPTAHPTDTPTEHPTKQPASTLPPHICKKPDEFLPYPGDCHKFIHCSNYIPYVFDCPANLEFSMKTKRCEYPEDAGCSGPYPTEKPTEAPTNPPLTPPAHVCKKPNEFLPYPGDCHKFIHCANYIPYVFTCPAHLEFSMKTHRCEWPEDAGCSHPCPTEEPTDTPTEVPTDTPTEAPTSEPLTPPAYICDKPNEFLPYPGDCHKFIHCSNYIPYVFDCPANLEFSMKTHRCEWPEDAGCSSTTPNPTHEPTVGPTGGPVTFAPHTCRKPNEFLPYPGDCHKFIHCSNYFPYVFDCPANLEFSMKTHRCEWPEDAGCSITTLKPTARPTERPTEGPTEQPTSTLLPHICKKPNEFLPYPGNCHKFIHCSNYIPYVFDCPANLEFSMKTHRCEWPEDAGCSITTLSPTARPTEHPTEHPTEGPTGQPASTLPPHICKKPNEFLPYPGDCHKFIHCSNYIPYVFDCPANLEFSMKTKRCEYPEDAGCSGPYPTEKPTEAPTAPPVTHPSHECKKPNEFLPYPGDCHKFIHCSNYIPYVFDCPANLEFSMKTHRCEWPEDAGCSITTLKPTARPTEHPTEHPTEGPTEQPGSTLPPHICKKPNEFLPYPGDCHRFIHCSNYIPYVFDCPANLEFSMKTKRCEYPEDAGCSGPYPTEKPTEAPTAPPVTHPSHECKKPNEFLPYPGDCHKFIHCANYIPYVFTCPANLEFSMKTHRCEWPEDAGCSITTLKPTANPTDAPTEAPTSAPVTYPSHICDKPNEFLPYPGDCHKFIHCANYIPYVFDCPANLEFSMKTHRCEWPEDAGCSITTLKPTEHPTEHPTEGPTKQPASTLPPHICKKPNEFLPYPGDCHRFIHCSNYIPYVFDCPANLEFSMKTHRCEWPEDAGCSGPYPTDKPTEPPTAPPVTYPSHICKKPNEFLPYPGDCHRFIHCANYIPYVFTCPADLEFSMRTHRCEWPEDAGCSHPYPTGTPTDTPTEGPTSAPVTYPSHVCDKPNEFLPYPGDCHKFIHCANYIPYVFDCPANLEFSMRTHRCEWPEDAGCSHPYPTGPTNPPVTHPDEPTTTSAPIVTLPPGTCPMSNGLMPYPGDCHKFIHCANGIAYVKKCPANLEFNPNLQVCDWPYRAGCSSQPGFKCPKPNGLFPDPNDCANFYTCKGGQGFLLKCPEGHAFDAKRQTCVKSDSCHNPLCPMPNGLFPAKDDCHNYVNCTEGKPITQTCPKGLVFNPEEATCDYDNGSCEPNPTAPPPTRPPDPPSPFVCPSDDCQCRFIDPDDCNGYYECHFGVAYHKNCSPGLVFNDDKKTCDFPSNVPRCWSSTPAPA